MNTATNGTYLYRSSISAYSHQRLAKSSTWWPAPATAHEHHSWGVRECVSNLAKGLLHASFVHLAGLA